MHRCPLYKQMIKNTVARSKPPLFSRATAVVLQRRYRRRALVPLPLPPSCSRAAGVDVLPRRPCAPAPPMSSAWLALPQLHLLHMPPDRRNRLARKAGSGRREANLFGRWRNRHGICFLVLISGGRKDMGNEELLEPSREGNCCGNFFFYFVCGSAVR